ncbi:stAR-related lipid transfer protein 7, mitochondrial [Callorhinchus milii]|uniref:StAR-related lipid transfer protein 7, mitochondrial n=1 Tax=Callorhinchus milii TaxID=7868 RepID=K4G026_CALMI|nr:stAR-related lipid transfer protein 7, mitochondrial [Callorhinchus milii]AFK10531.1 stAR-related lipid transfer protein 7, mitochondrial isoform 2 [Callorhinchus milii]
MLTLRRPATVLNSAPVKPFTSLYSHCVKSACFTSRAPGWQEGRRLDEWCQRAGSALRWAPGCLRGEVRNGVSGRSRMVTILASQCSYVTGLRLRRAQQIAQLYSNIYSEKSRRSLLSSLWRRFHSRHSGSCKLVAAFAAVFMWDEERIRDEELNKCVDEFKDLNELLTEKPAASEAVTCCPDHSWELVMDRAAFRLWRRPIQGSHLYQYRVFGTYSDVTPRQFFNVQLDTEYRKKWDELVIKLEVIEKDEVSGSEIVHWVTHFPYPMYSRDYVYIRRHHVDHSNRLMVLVSRAVEHPNAPESHTYVRVKSYESQMIIRPHRSFDENGFGYLLTYSDNPESAFPRYCVSWMVSSGMPDFLEKLHQAAVRARNLEINVKDYIVAKVPETPENKVVQSTERPQENSSSQQMEYA